MSDTDRLRDAQQKYDADLAAGASAVPTTPTYAEPRARVAFLVPGGRITATISADGRTLDVRGIADVGPFSDSVDIRPHSSNAFSVRLAEMDA